MRNIQRAILSSAPEHGRYLHFDLLDALPRETLLTCLSSLAEKVDGDTVLVGIGQTTVINLGCSIDGLAIFPENLLLEGSKAAKPVALWCWLRGSERGDLMHEALMLERLLSSAFKLRYVVDAFTHQSGRDLTGYEDGTENPKGQAAVEAAFVADDSIEGLCGSSFVVVQQWQHRWSDFERMSKSEQDDVIGRERISNEELEKAPMSAHVKRTAQESFEPEAFILRRSMSWIEGQKSGLMFVGFGKNFDAFEAQWSRMLGCDDGLLDALFCFSQPQSNDYYWCPPIYQGKLDLTALNILTKK